jgi:uncharacterized sporulation protein YeaH/YhbH (DUF444 family)
MKRIIVIALACALAPLASAQLYKSVGPDGKVIYTDQPPAGADAKQINVQPSGGPTQKTAVERDKEAQKGRDAAIEKAKKAEASAKNDSIKDNRCAQSKADYQIYSEGGRIGKINEKGERVLMDDADIEKEKARVRAVMEEACRK